MGVDRVIGVVGIWEWIGIWEWTGTWGTISFAL